MAYTKQNWECGDLITADKMNHIEDGIEEAGSGGGTTDYYLIEFDYDPEVGSANLIIVPNGNYSEAIRVDSSSVDKLPLLYRIFTQEKWIPLGSLGWQIGMVSEGYALFSDSQGHTIEIDAEGE